MAAPTIGTIGAAGYPGFSVLEGVPTGAVDGNVYILGIQSRDNANTAHTLTANGTGWTKFFDQHHVDASSKDLHLSLWWKVRSGTLTAPTVNSALDGGSLAYIFYVHGANTTTPIEVVGTVANTDPAIANYVITGVTTGNAAELVFCVGLAGAQGTVTSATGACTTVLNNNLSNSNGNNSGGAVTYATFATAGATGTTTFDSPFGSSAYSEMGVMFAVQAPAGTTTATVLRSTSATPEAIATARRSSSATPSITATALRSTATATRGTSTSRRSTAVAVRGGTVSLRSSAAAPQGHATALRSSSATASSIATARRASAAQPEAIVTARRSTSATPHATVLPSPSFIAAGATGYPLYFDPGLPAGTTSGDLCLLMISSCDASLATHSLSANGTGWSKFFDGHNTDASSRSLHTSLWWKIVSGTLTPPSITTTGLDSSATSALYTFRGTDTSAPISVVGTQTDQVPAVGTTITASSITTLVTNELVVGFVARSGDTGSWTAATGAVTTVVGSTGNGTGNLITTDAQYLIWAAPGSVTGAATFTTVTAANAGHSALSLLFSIMPPATGGTGTARRSTTAFAHVPGAPVASPTYVAAGTLGNPTYAITAGLPAGMASGDLCLMVIASCDAALAAHTLASNGSGWTKFFDGNNTDASSRSLHLSLWWTIYSGTLVAPTVSTTGLDNSAIYRISAYRGTSQTTPISVIGTQADQQTTTGPTTFNANGITTGGPFELAVAIGIRSGVLCALFAPTGGVGVSADYTGTNAGNQLIEQAGIGAYSTATATGATTFNPAANSVAGYSAMGLMFSFMPPGGGSSQIVGTQRRSSRASPNNAFGGGSLPVMPFLTPLGAYGPGNPGYVIDRQFDYPLWTNTTPTWVALDLGPSAPARVLFRFVLEGSDIDAPGAAPSNYTIETSANSTTGSDGTWVQAASVVSNPYSARAHLIDPAQRWIRLSVTSPGTTSLGEIEVWDATAGTEDTFLFLGDSITERWNLHSYGNPSFQDDVNTARSPHRPMQVGAGHVGGALSGFVLGIIDAMLAAYPMVRQWCIGIGTNDAQNGNTPATTNFAANLQTVVNKIVAAGHVPMICRIPYTQDSYYGPTIPQFNTVIDAVTAFQRAAPGPRSLRAVPGEQLHLLRPRHGRRPPERRRRHCHLAALGRRGRSALPGHRGHGAALEHRGTQGRRDGFALDHCQRERRGHSAAVNQGHPAGQGHLEPLYCDRHARRHGRAAVHHRGGAGYGHVAPVVCGHGADQLHGAKVVAGEHESDCNCAARLGGHSGWRLYRAALHQGERQRTCDRAAVEQGHRQRPRHRDALEQGRRASQSHCAPLHGGGHARRLAEALGASIIVGQRLRARADAARRPDLGERPRARVGHRGPPGGPPALQRHRLNHRLARSHRHQRDGEPPCHHRRRSHAGGRSDRHASGRVALDRVDVPAHLAACRGRAHLLGAGPDDEARLADEEERRRGRR